MNFNRFFGELRTVLTRERMERAIDLVKLAAKDLPKDNDKRAFVITELMKIPGIDENMARILVEAAVKYVKLNEDTI